MLQHSSIRFALRLAFIRFLSHSRIDGSLGFGHGVACVIIRIGFVVCAVVSDALDYDFGVVAAGEGAFRVGPIAFGLAFVVTGHRPLPMLVLAKMTGRFGRIVVNREIAERVDCVAFLARLDDEFLGEFVVSESWQAQYARRVRCRQIAAELICKAMKERLCLVLGEPTHFPHDLVLARRGIEDKVRRWDFG